MNHILEFNPAKRQVIYNKFISEATKFLASPIVRASKIVSPGETILLTSEKGFRLWQDLLENHYLLSANIKIGTCVNNIFNGKRPESMHRKAWSTGQNFLSKKQCQELSDYFESISNIDEINLPKVTKDCFPPESIIKAITSINATVNQLTQTWFNIKTYSLPWRIHYYRTSPTSISLSNKWHYDFEIARNCFFVLIYLNDAPGYGTMIYDKETSEIISKKDGYIAAHSGYRATNLDFYANLPRYYPPSLCKAATGSALIFCPSLCLHKGIVPQPEIENNNNTKRKVLHISYCLTDNGHDLEACKDAKGGILANLESIGIPPFLT